MMIIIHMRPKNAWHVGSFWAGCQCVNPIVKGNWEAIFRVTNDRNSNNNTSQKNTSQNNTSQNNTSFNNASHNNTSHTNT